jgi:hypothetical protein
MLDSGETAEPPDGLAPSSRWYRFLRLRRDRQLQVVVGLLAVVTAAAIVAPHLPGRAGLITGSYGVHGVSGGEASGAPSGQPTPGVPGLTPPPPAQQGSETPEQLATSVQVSAQLAAALRTWNSGPGGKKLSQISNDVGMALQSGGIKQYVEMKAACGNLTTLISSAGTSPPIPNTAMQNEYTAALSALTKAAADCRSAISEQVDGDEYVETTENAEVLALAQTEFTSGIKSIADITIVIEAAMRSA